MGTVTPEQGTGGGIAKAATGFVEEKEGLSLKDIIMWRGDSTSTNTGPYSGVFSSCLHFTSVGTVTVRYGHRLRWRYNRTRFIRICFREEVEESSFANTCREVQENRYSPDFPVVPDSVLKVKMI